VVKRQACLGPRVRVKSASKLLGVKTDAVVLISFNWVVTARVGVVAANTARASAARCTPMKQG